MNVASIISRARKLSKTTVSNVSDTDALSYLNTIKDEFYAEICSRNEEDYNWEEWKSTSVVGVSEYTLPPLTSLGDGTKALKSVNINYDGVSYPGAGLVYLQAKLVNPISIGRDWDFYKANQPYNNPIYYIADNSIFIAPVPKSVIASSIKMTGIRKIPDYTMLTLESDVGIPVDFHRVLIAGLAYELSMDKGVPFEDESRFLSQYEMKKTKAIQGLSMRKEGPVELSYPSDINSSFDPLDNGY